MTNNSINFKKERDFGDLFNSTFNFISQEFKRLGTVILYYVVPILLLMAIAVTVYTMKIQDVSQAMKQVTPEGNSALFKTVGTMYAYVGIVMLLMLVSTGLLMGAVYCYIKLYIEQGRDGFTVNDVWRSMMSNIFPLMIGILLAGIVVCIGFAFCILPGIYFGIALSLLFCTMIFEGKSFSESFKRSLKLVNPNWWFTFGISIISIIIVYVLSVLISIPSLILGFKSLFTSIKGGQFTAPDYSIGYYVISSVTQLLTQLLTVVPIVLTAFMYFSFIEKNEKRSLFEKIDQINADE
jgi:hypothetical protein